MIVIPYRNDCITETQKFHPLLMLLLFYTCESILATPTFDESSLVTLVISSHFIINFKTTMTICRSVDSDK